jgi:hypothetical protein
MSDGIREELQALLFDSAPPADVDGEALFARTFASEEGAGADLLPPDGLFDLPADDPAFDDAAFDDPAFDPAPDGAGPGDGVFGDEALSTEGVTAADGGTDTADSAGDDAGDSAGDDVWGDPAADADPAGELPEVPFEPGAGW